MISMSDLHDCRSSSSNNTEIQNFPDIESAKAGAHTPAELIQQVHQANHDEICVHIPPKIDLRCIYRVSPHLRANTKQQMYDPMVVSLGPYHHGKPQFHQMEEFKEEGLNQFISESIATDPTKDRDFFHWQIMKNINILRKNYEEVEYSDEALVDIVLRDACFLIGVMDIRARKYCEIWDCLGAPTAVLVQRDMHILDNQIPFWVILCLLYLSHNRNDADKIVYMYLNRSCYLKENRWLTKLPLNDDGSKALHLLEAQRTILLKRDPSYEVIVEAKPPFLSKIFKCKRFWKTCNDNMSSWESIIEDLNLWGRSVIDLQAKGIYFKPSSQCLQDITFTSYHLFGVLCLPILVIDNNTKVLFSNITALEMSPKGFARDEIMSYVNFMKSLIDTSKDVKELREQGILYSTIGNDAELVKMFKEIDTFGMNNNDKFTHVRRAINKHCRSKAKTWMADLYHNYFRSPWAIIAVFGTTFVLSLTFLQTYYTIHPTN